MPLDADDKKEIMRYEEEQKKEWNRVLIAHTRKVRNITKPSPQFPKTIEKACEEYFTICETDGVKPSVAGLSVALGVNREILLSWVRGEVSIESADVIRQYFALLEIFDETALKDGKTNALSGIFLAKNNYGYKDQVEHKIIDEKERSNEEIEMRYNQLHEIVSETPKEIEIVEAEIERPSMSKTKKSANKKTKKDKSVSNDIEEDSEVPF